MAPTINSMKRIIANDYHFFSLRNLANRCYLDECLQSIQSIVPQLNVSCLALEFIWHPKEHISKMKSIFSEEIFLIVLIYVRIFVCILQFIFWKLYLIHVFYILIFSSSKFWYESAKVKTFCHVIHCFKRYC